MRSLKHKIEALLTQALTTLETEQQHSLLEQQAKIKLENTTNKAHGDYASNAAIVLAQAAQCTPRELATQIKASLPTAAIIEKVEIAGIGFINFFLAPAAHHETILNIIQQKEHTGSANIGDGERLLIEFVSANPTGPLHVGHGRGAAYGSTLKNLLEKVGYSVDCEYYINDIGRQMDILTVSIWLRYLQHQGQPVPFPRNGYLGDYIKQLAVQLSTQYNRRFIMTQLEELAALNEQDAPEKELDDTIKFCLNTLGEEHYQTILEFGKDAILTTIKSDLRAFGVTFDNWFSERSLLRDNTIDHCIKKLAQKDLVYDKDGAKWFRATQCNDEKDRVLIRENGQLTYFASDIAYHWSKRARGYNKILNVWGADHHGYIARLKGAMQALGVKHISFDILLVQFATLYRNKEKLAMSTRAGDFITLKTLLDEVGKNAARFFYIMRKSNQHLDFDLDLAKSKKIDNPIIYIQYAHARICSVFKKVNNYQPANTAALTLLNSPHEQQLMRRLGEFDSVIENAATTYEPHQIAYYLKALANDFHAYYNAEQFILKTDSDLQNARLTLIEATKYVISSGLKIFGIKALENM